MRVCGGLTVYPPSRTLEILDFDEKSTFDFFASNGLLKLASLSYFCDLCVSCYSHQPKSFVNRTCSTAVRQPQMQEVSIRDLLLTCYNQCYYFSWELFSKIGLHGWTRNCYRISTMEPDFWKKFSSSRKRGGADFSPGFVWWVVWAESPIQI